MKNHLESRTKGNNSYEKRLDRLSCLPDCIIHEMFKFMETKHAVQTCVLSRRWRNLWKSVTTLNFHSRSFDTARGLTKFVSNVLSNRERFFICSLMFSISWATYSGFGPNFQLRLFDKLIDHAISHNTRELILDIGFWCKVGRPTFLDRVFDHQSLERLAISIYLDENIQLLPNSLALGSLTSLYLETITFSKEFYSECPDLFSECKSLKNLSIIRCSVYDLEAFCIFCPQLENFTFKLCNIRGNVFKRCEVLVSCSKLTYLSLDGFPPLKLTAYDLSSIVTVELNNSSPLHRRDPQFIELLQELHNVKFLTLHLPAIENMALHLSENQTSPFHNLRLLKIKADKRDFILPNNVKAYLLNNSPDTTITIEPY